MLKIREQVQYLTSDIFKICIPRSYSTKDWVVWKEFGIEGCSLQEFGKLGKMVLKYNDKTEKEVKSFIDKVNLPSQYVSIQFRSGDKILEYDHLLESDKAIKRIQESGVEFTNIFVFSDNYSFVEELRKKTSYNIYTLTEQNERGYVNEEFNKITWDTKRRMLIKMFAAIDICLASDVHFGNEQTCVNNYIKSVRDNKGYYPIWTREEAGILSE